MRKHLFEVAKARSLRALIWVSVAVILTFWLSNRLGVRSPSGGGRPVAEAAILSVPEELLNIGEIWENERLKWVAPLKNVTGEEVEVGDIVSTCNCTSVEPRKLTIPPGETREICITIDASATKVSETERWGLEVGIIPVIIRPKEARLPPWTIRGLVRRTVRFYEPVLDLGSHSQVAQPLPVRKTSFVASSAVGSMRVVTDVPGFRAEIYNHGDGPHELRLEQKAVLPNGRHRFNVVVTPESLSGDLLPPRTLPVVLTILNDFQPTPPLAVFGARPLGDTAEETVSFSSLTNRRFQVVGFVVKGKGLSVEKMRADKDAEVFLLKQQIEQLGQNEGKVTFTMKDNAGTETEVPLIASYLGVEASSN